MAATNASEPNPNGKGLLHYLRTTNPMNPENLAVQAKRLSTNRPNPYQFPGAFSNLGSGLPVYENRQCNGSNFLEPLLPTAIGSIITPGLNALINQFVFGGVSSGSQVAAPPCKLQGDFPSQGQVPAGQPSTTHYPHVWAAGPPS